MKTKLKKLFSTKVAYWTGIIIFGAILGVSLQLARAGWQEPAPGTVPPTGGNVAAPINTSDNSQLKLGNLSLNSSGTWSTGLLVPNGTVSIGTAIPDNNYKLDVYGDAIVRGYDSGTSKNEGLQLTMNGMESYNLDNPSLASPLYLNPSGQNGDLAPSGSQVIIGDDWGKGSHDLRIANGNLVLTAGNTGIKFPDNTVQKTALTFAGTCYAGYFTPTCTCGNGTILMFITGESFTNSNGGYDGCEVDNQNSLNVEGRTNGAFCTFSCFN